MIARSLTGPNQGKPKPMVRSDRERKLNVVIFKIPECQESTIPSSKVRRLREDFHPTTEATNECDDLVSPQAIGD